MLNEHELEEIRRKLRELEEEPPVAGWQNIQKELNPRKRWRLFWWVPLAVLLLVGTGVLIVQNRKNDTQKILLKAPQSAKTMAGTPAVSKQPTAGLKANKPMRALLSESANRNSSTNKQSLVNRNTSGLKPDATKEKPGVKALNKSSSNKMALSTVTEAEKITNNHTPSKIFKKPAEPEAESTDTNTPEKESLPTTSTHINPLLTDSTAWATQPDSAIVTKQENTPTKKKLAPERLPAKPGSWTLGLFFAPRYTFRAFTPNTQDEILITRVNQQDTLGPRHMGYELGLNVARVLTPKLNLEAGLSLMQLRENIAYSFITGAIDSSGITSVQAPDGSVTVSASYVMEDRRLVSTYTYGGLRLGTTYYFGSSARHRYSLTFAAGANLLLKGKTRQFVNNNWIETVTFPSPKNILEQSNYNLLLGAGYNVPLGPKYEFMVMPAVNYFLGSTFKKREPFGLRPYSFGITFQVKRIFRK